MPRPQRVLTFAVVFLILCLGCSLALGQNNVLTQHNDNTRSGLNANEVLLTPANVNVNTFGKLFTQNVDGQIAGQPLYVSQILMGDGLVHNVVFVATQNNTVYAFDADSTQGNNANPIWSVNLDNGGTPDPISDYGCTGTHYTEIGIMGTPVIDPGLTTIYVVAKTVTGTGPSAARNFSLHALDIANGSELLGGPVGITGTAPSGNGSGTFNPVYQMQRPALLLQNGVVYVGFGGNGCDEYAYNGWLFAYNSQTLQQEAAFLITPDGTRGSIWQGGSGPAVDEYGYIYVATANGTYDGPSQHNDFGDTVLKMSWNGGVFGMEDYFTPYNQSALANRDLDLGSAGPLILPDQPGLYPHELVAGGKQGTLYLVNRDDMGGFNSQTDNVIQEIPKAVVSELTGVPTYWNNSVYVAGEGDYIKQFALVNGLLSSAPVSETPISFTGFGPASTSITANGNTNAILWAIQHSTPALYAFDPTNLANEFWNSTQAAKLRDKLVPVMRFVTPTISNGKVYVSGSSALAVYGLLPLLSVGTGNNQTGVEKTVLPVPLSVVASDAYFANPMAGIAVTCKDGGAGGTFSPSSTQTTNSSGTVTYSYTLPAKAINITITCTSPGYISAVFNETSTTGVATSLIIVSGNNQTTPPNAPLPAPIVVKAENAKGFGVQGVPVNFTDNGAGGTFSATTVDTGSNGNATVQYTMGPKTGKVTITASSSGLKSVSFAETAVIGPAAIISVTGGNNQSGTVATKLTQALTALVTDAYNNPVSGVSVSFSDGGAGGTFSGPNPVVTGSNGTVTESYTLPVAAGTVTITATATGVTNPATFTESALPGPPAIVAIISGNSQSATVATQLPQALTVEVTDQFGNPEPNISVTFSDGGAGGTFYNPNPGLTGASGQVSQTYLLPTTAGTITITATANGVTKPATFTETAVVGNAANISISSGNDQTAPNGTQLPLPLVVLVTDQYNNPVAGVSVTFSDGGVGGAFSGPNPGPTGTNGTASQMYTLPAVAGETITITATAAGITNPVTFTEYGQ
jgi:Big-like domain-containing protein